MSLTDKERCIFCDKVGNLLVCSDDGCPISVHKDCMGCKARFGENGDFYCPYCVYRRLCMETCKLRDRAMSAKKGLSIFLGENNRDGMGKGKEQICLEENQNQAEKRHESKQTDVTPDNGKEQICLEENQNQVEKHHESEHTDGSPNNGKERICLEEDQNQVEKCHESGKTDQTPNNGKEQICLKENQNQVEKHHESEQTDRTPNTCRIMVVYEAQKEPIRVDSCKEKGGLSNTSIEKQTTCRKRKLTEEGIMKQQEHSRHPATGVETTNSSSVREVQNSSADRFERWVKPSLLKGRRIRLRWTVEEEDMLRKAVEKISSEEHTYFPWKKVMELGRHVFEPSRTTNDLRDKWRNLSKDK